MLSSYLSVIAGLIFLPLILSSNSKAESNPAMVNERKCDLTAINLLADVIDTIMTHNADYLKISDSLKNLAPGPRDSALARLAEKNAADPAINAAIENLLHCPAYQLYYRQFKYIDTSVHKKVFFALPYQAINCPGDIAGNFLELCRNHDQFQTWAAETIAKINVSRSHEIALQWLPPGEYTIPMTYFIYDGFGDAFALKNAVCFDIYSLVISKVPEAERFKSFDSNTTAEIENILAHEYHHVYAGRYLHKKADSTDSWGKQWIDYFLSRIVSEGVAMQCNPPAGFKKNIYEDTATVAYWIAQLNEKFAALQKGTISGDTIAEWNNANGGETAKKLLLDYLQKKFPQENSEKLLQEHIIERPIFEYVLGWWMTARILATPNGKDKVMQILSAPEKIFAFYNQSIPESATNLRLTFSY